MIRAVLVGILAWGFADGTPVSADDGPWRYGREAGAKHEYEVTATVEVGGEKTQLQGVIRYQVDAVTDDQIQLTYRGRLREKVQNRRSRFPGPAFPPTPRFPPFLGTTSFGGLIERTSRLTLSRKGELLTMEGDTQLPFLFGNAALLPFEILPSDDGSEIADGATWSRRDAILISSIDRSFPAALLRSRLTANEKTTHTAEQETEYRLAEHDEQGARIERSVRMTSPEALGQRKYEFYGTDGTWEFDFETGMPKSAVFPLTLKVTEENVQLTVPIILKYRKLSDDEIAEREAEAERRAEQEAQERAERERVASLPITAAEKSEILQGLESDRPFEQIQALQKLSTKKPSDPDPELVQAIQKHTASPDRAVALTAERVLERWLPEYGEQRRVERAYREGGTVAPSGRRVDHNTPLAVGQLVQFKEHELATRRRPATVVDLQPDGSVSLQPTGFGRGRPVIVPRDRIELAPEGIRQPAGIDAVSPFESPSDTSPETARIWTDDTGRFRIEATLLEISGDQVKLKRTDGKEISVALEKLSPFDRHYVEQQPGSPDKAVSDNPFD